MSNFNGTEMSKQQYLLTLKYKNYEKFKLFFYHVYADSIQRGVI